MTEIGKNSALVVAVAGAIGAWTNARSAHDRVDSNTDSIKTVNSSLSQVYTHDQLEAHFRAFVERVNYMATQADATHRAIFERLDAIERRMDRSAGRRRREQTVVPPPLPPLPTQLPAATAPDMRKEPPG